MFIQATAPLVPTEPSLATQATKPANGLGATSASQSFAGLMGSIQGEVERFIRQGAGAGPTEGMGADSQLQRLRVQGLQPEAALPGAQQSFLDQIAPLAAAAGERLGVAPEILSAHAALESGWGEKPLRREDGTSTFNLFGIKAGPGWRGEAASAATTEYVGGQATAATERFRSYPDAAAAFKDFTAMIGSSPRFRAALNVGGDAVAYAKGLAAGGYATDPAYADKLTRVIGQVQRAR